MLLTAQILTPRLLKRITSLFASNSAYCTNTYSPTPKKNYRTIPKQFYLLHKYLLPNS